MMSNDPKEKQDEKPKSPKIDWDHEQDNCGINSDENPCGDANEY